jgi:cystathionine beta-lyase/cystathionine gamma-synthase
MHVRMLRDRANAAIASRSSTRKSIVISPNNGANAERLARQRLPEGLIRLSVGLEGADALIADLTQALDAASA